MKSVVQWPRTSWRADVVAAGERTLAEEMPVAIVHDGSTTAVMMATPDDLEDFAVGFSLSEGIIRTTSDIRSVDIVTWEDGIEARIWLKADMSARQISRRRRITGPTGCGLCGVESLAEAKREPRDLSKLEGFVTSNEILLAMRQLEEAQQLGRATRAIHAAALWSRERALVIREDVGRHNALDKLVGVCAMAGRATEKSILLLTSRLSIEMIQKAQVLGAPIVCAVSAPTGLAVRTAEQAGITLIGIARSDGFEVFTRSDRIRPTMTS